MKLFRSEKAKDIFVRNTSLILSVLGIVIGVILATRFNENIPRVITPGIPYLSLQEMVDKLDKEHTQLKQSLVVVNDKINVLEGETKKRQSGLSSEVDANEKLKIDSGIGEMSGEGIVILLDDSEQRKPASDSIAHASDMRDLVDYLWQNSAKAISIKGSGGMDERVGPSTSIDCIVNTVLINGTKTVPPFQVKAIGDREKLISAINDRVALKQIYDRVDKEGLKFYVIDGVTKIEIPKFTGNILTENVKVKGNNS